MVRLIHEREIELGEIDDLDVEAAVLDGPLAEPVGNRLAGTSRPGAGDESIRVGLDIGRLSETIVDLALKTLLSGSLLFSTKPCKTHASRTCSSCPPDQKLSWRPYTPQPYDQFDNGKHRGWGRLRALGVLLLASTLVRSYSSLCPRTTIRLAHG